MGFRSTRAFARHTVITVLLAATAGSIHAGDNAFFGDLHVHTSYSFDAYLFGTRQTPDHAYRFAQGKAIRHPGGFDLQLDRPLDFFAVTDHAFFLGMWEAMNQPGHPLNRDPEARDFLDVQTRGERGRAFARAGRFLGEHRDLNAARTAWQDIIETANRHNKPGSFTTFIGYEYTSSRNRGNLHRNVIFAGGAAPALPFSRLESLNPEALWTWMDEQRKAGYDAISIPHNSNGSNGEMFQLVAFDGSAIDRSWVQQRMRNEPLVENTQIKGTSDTHPFLSPNDEWADFEIYPYRIASRLKSQPQGSYVREAWLNGLSLGESGPGNPYRFGVVGSSDTHNAGTPFDESKFPGAAGLLSHTPESRGSVAITQTDDGLRAFSLPTSRFNSASGLAAVWADENTRANIFAAFRRKETFSTSGTRIRVRFFAGYGLDTSMLVDNDSLKLAYNTGKPMGGTIRAERKGVPEFLFWAARDPYGAPLERVQIIKGWVQDGERRERIFDVGCSGNAEVNPQTGRCPDNGATVNVRTCKTTEGSGANQIRGIWRDPGFDRKQNAFYYVRVLENPTCRWSTWDAVGAGQAPNPDLPRFIQERAWTSPIWFTAR